MWSKWGALWYALAILAFLVVNVIFKIDRDHGGYEDRLRQKDKLWHFIGCMIAAMLAVFIFRVHPIASWALTSVGGVGFEFTQGYTSKWDIVADTAGAALGSAAAWLTVAFLL